MEYSRNEFRTFFFVIIAVFAGPVMVWNSIGAIYTAISSKSWPTVPGEIFDAQVERTSSRWLGRYQATVTFGYKVDGQSYTSTRLTHGDPERFSDSVKASMEARRYVPGTPVDVHYHPKDPKVAVLQTGSTGSNWLTLIIGVGISAFGYVMAWRYWRSLQSTTLRPRSGTGF